MNSTANQKPVWTVTSVTPRKDYTLMVTFVSGEKKIVDMSKVIAEGGVFKKLEDPKVFMMAHVDSPTVVWNQNIDIAPEFLYDNGTIIKN